VCASIYYLELAAVPFQLLFSLGFGLVAWLSLRHAWLARKLSAAGRARALAVAGSPVRENEAAVAA
jgi:hypothetical protein